MSALPRTVLYIEDNAGDVRVLQHTIRELGLNLSVVAVSDGERALSFLETMLPAMIVVDLGLPKLGGVALLNALKADARLKDIPTVVLTGIQPDSLTSVENISKRFLQKPMTLDGYAVVAHQLSVLCGSAPQGDGSVTHQTAV